MKSSYLARRSASNFGTLWFLLLRDLFYSRSSVSPRAIETREILNVNFELTNPRRSLLISPERNPSYRFAVAEWLWIWFGHRDVRTISQYNQNLSHFSDDGVVFNGAYGPEFQRVWQQLANLLDRDRDTRQAIVPIYRTPPGPTKDVPCTLTLQFLLREEKLHAIANMRSSDIWLGLPYDVFNFSMMQQMMAAAVGAGLGSLYLNLGSSHLYASNFEAAERVLEAGKLPTAFLIPTHYTDPPLWLDNVLQLKDRSAMPRQTADPWLSWVEVLLSETNKDAFAVLERMTR